MRERERQGERERDTDIKDKQTGRKTEGVRTKGGRKIRIRYKKRHHKVTEED